MTKPLTIIALTLAALAFICSGVDGQPVPMPPAITVDPLDMSAVQLSGNSVNLPSPEWAVITVENIPLANPWPGDMTKLYQSPDLTSWQFVASQHYEPVEVFALPVTAAQTFYRAGNDL